MQLADGITRIHGGAVGEHEARSPVAGLLHAHDVSSPADGTKLFVAVNPAGQPVQESPFHRDDPGGTTIAWDPKRPPAQSFTPKKVMHHRRAVKGGSRSLRVRDEIQRQYRCNG